MVAIQSREHHLKMKPKTLCLGPRQTHASKLFKVSQMLLLRLLQHLHLGKSVETLYVIPQ
jgi:hypothetical protein